MDRPRRLVCQRSYLQVMDDRLLELQNRSRVRSVNDNGTEEEPELFTGVALAIRRTLTSRAAALEQSRLNEAMADEFIAAMRLGYRAEQPATPLTDEDATSSTSGRGSSTEQSGSSYHPEVPARSSGVPQAANPHRLSCPNPACNESFISQERLDGHLELGDGLCPKYSKHELPEIDMKCSYCGPSSRVFANRGNLAVHKNRCKKRSHPVPEIVADGSFGFGLAGGTDGVEVRFRCAACGAAEAGPSHHRECPAQPHTRVPVSTHEHVSSPNHEFVGLPPLSFVDDAMPASSWTWLDTLDFESLPLARPLHSIPAWVINGVQHIINTIMSERLCVRPDDERGARLIHLIPLLIYDSVCLRAGRNGQLLTTLKRRVTKFAQGKWSELHEDVAGSRGRRSARADPTEHQILSRALKFILANDLRKARQALNPVATAPADITTAECLHALHPPSTSTCPPHIVNYVPDSPFVLDRDVFDEVVKSLPRGRAPGRSGWRFEDVSYLCKPGSVCADAVFEHCRAVAAGLVSSDGAGRLWGTASLIALQKPNNGIRPIAMGEVFRKLVSRVMLRQIGSAACEAVGEFQFGVARPGGLEAVVLALRVLLEDDPANVILSVDVSNAYNTFDRFKAMDLMLENPALAPCVPFLRMLYGSPAALVFDMDDDGPYVIESERGTQQGDPWSSLLFSLVHTDAMDRVRAVHPGITALSYQDDTNIITDIHTAAAVFATVESEFSRVGLSVNKSKCAVYTRADVPSVLESVFGGMTVARDGLMVLGSPLGSNAFIREKVELRLEEYCNGLELLPKLEHPQAAFKLLRDSFNRRAEFLARTVPFGVCGDLFVKFDARLWETTSGIMQFDKLNAVPQIGTRLANAFCQAFMPVRNGGLGLRSITRVNSYAFLGSVMDTAFMLRSDSRVCAFFGSVESADSEFRRSIVRARDELPIDARALVPSFPEFINARRLRSQAHITEKAEDSCFDSFLHYHTAPKDRARLLSASGTGAGAWLLARPGAQDLSLSPTLFITAVCRLLGLPLPSLARALTLGPTSQSGHYVCGFNGCGHDVDMSGDHIIQCTKHAARSVRHRTIVDKLVPYLVEAGYHVTREDSSVYPVRAGDRGPRKMDLVARDVRHGEQNLCIDVSIVDATLNSNVDRNAGSSVVRMFAAGAAVKGKETHYRDTPAGYRLVPFVVEVHGALAQPAVELVRTLADRIAPRRAGLGGGAATPASTSSRSLAVQKALIKNELKQMLSIAVQRCHALSLEKGANYLVGRLAQTQAANARRAQAVAGAREDHAHEDPE